MNLQKTVDWETVAHKVFDHPPTNRDIVTLAFDLLEQHFHAASYNRGWWHDPITGLSLIPGDESVDGFQTMSMDQDVMRRAWFPYVVATKIALIHSETTEM